MAKLSPTRVKAALAGLQDVAELRRRVADLEERDAGAAPPQPTAGRAHRRRAGAPGPPRPAGRGEAPRAPRPLLVVTVTGGSPAAPGRLFLHVGSPKTGTTFLQNVLWSHRQAGRGAGTAAAARQLRRPLPRQPRRARAVRRGRAPGARRRDVGPGGAPGAGLAGHVPDLPRAVRGGDRRAGLACPGEPRRRPEVHVVLTARDLVRQIPAEWQEHVKHRYPGTLAEFVDDLRADGPEVWFWRVQDVARDRQPVGPAPCPRPGCTW